MNWILHTVDGKLEEMQRSKHFFNRLVRNPNLLVNTNPTHELDLTLNSKNSSAPENIQEVTGENEAQDHDKQGPSKQRHMEESALENIPEGKEGNQAQNRHQ